jgi:hypothetical protein
VVVGRRAAVFEARARQADHDPLRARPSTRRTLARRSWRSGRSR